MDELTCLYIKRFQDSRCSNKCWKDEQRQNPQNQKHKCCSVESGQTLSEPGPSSQWSSVSWELLFTVSCCELQISVSYEATPCRVVLTRICLSDREDPPACPPSRALPVPPQGGKPPPEGSWLLPTDPPEQSSGVERRRRRGPMGEP